jgi:YD repeat-containing protein
VPNPITPAQLTALEQQDLNGTPAGVASFYATLYNTYGYGYAGLAEGVVTDSSLSGVTAYQYLLNSAAAQGVTLTPTDIGNIENSLATSYAQTLIDSAQNGVITQDISFSQAQDFHTADFAEFGLGPQTWTLYEPGQVLGAQALQSDWQNLTGDSAGTQLYGLAELTAQIADASTVTPGSTPTPTQQAAQQWLSDVVAAGATGEANAIATAASVVVQAIENGLQSLSDETQSWLNSVESWFSSTSSLLGTSGSSSVETQNADGSVTTTNYSASGQAIDSITVGPLQDTISTIDATAGGGSSITTDGVSTSGTQQYQQTTNTAANGTTSASIFGAGDDATLSNASITLSSNTSATVTGADNAIITNGGDSLTLTGNNNSVAIGSGGSTTITGTGIESLALTVAGSTGVVIPFDSDASSVTLTDNGAQTEAIAQNAAGQILSDTVQGDPGSANPDYLSTVTNTYNTDGTLAQTTASNSDGITAVTTYNYQGGGYGGYGGYGGGSEETGSTTASQDAYGVSIDTVTTNGNTVTDDYQFTDPSGNTLQTDSVATTNADGDRTVNTTSTLNGVVEDTDVATYNSGGDLLQDNSAQYAPDGSLSYSNAITNTYNDAGQLQTSVQTVVGEGFETSSTDTTTTNYSYYPDGTVNTTNVTEQFDGPGGSFSSQTNQVFTNDGTQTVNDNFFSGTGAYAPSPPPPSGGGGNRDSGSGGSGGGGGYVSSGGDGSYGSDGGDGGYSGGGYSFVGSSTAPISGSNSNIGVIAQYDLAHGQPIAALIAEGASNQDNAAITDSQLSSASGNAVLEGVAWDTQVVTWSFGSGAGPNAALFSNSISSQYQATIGQAFAAWGAASGLTFEEVPDSASSDIRVGFGDFQTSTTGVAGYTNYQSTDGALNGAIIRLEDPTQDPLTIGANGQLTYEGTDATLLQVAEHEIGHALGFADNSDPSSILYGVAGGDNQTFDATDLAGIALLYGGSSPPSQMALASTGSSEETYSNGANQLVIADTKNSDGSSNDVSYSYNSDGSYVETAVAIPAGSSTATSTVYDISAQGQVTSEQVTSPGSPTTTYTYNAAGQLLTNDTTNADGSTNDLSYTYNADGSYVETAVATPAGGGTPTTTVYDINAQGQLISENVTNPDGSTIAYTYNAAGLLLTDYTTYAFNADGSYIKTDVYTVAGASVSSSIVQDYGVQGQLLSQSITNTDGSTDDTTFNADGSYTETDTQPVTGGTMTTVSSFNANNQLITQFVTNADGSTNDSTYAYNSDGSYSDTDVATSASSGTTTTVDDYDTNNNLISETVTFPDGTTEVATDNGADQLYTNPDGSTDDRTYAFNADGSYTKTDVYTAAGASVSSTMVQDYGVQGQLLSQSITNTDGSTDDTTFNADGSYTETDTQPVTGGTMTTVSSFNANNQLITQFVANADGSTNDSTYAYNGDGSYSDTVVATPAGGEATTTVYSYGSSGQLQSADTTNPDGSVTDSSYNGQGQVVNTNNFVPSANGSYTDTWSTSNGAAGEYWWNSSTYEYQDTWHNADGSSFTDTYQYASGGSPGASGYSFTETYSDSSGDTGSRTYDAATGVTTVSWDSAQTGAISGTRSGDAGFVGLTQEGELTNTQTDLSFFNPNVSPVFNTLLSEHH